MNVFNEDDLIFSIYVSIWDDCRDFNIFSISIYSYIVYCAQMIDNLLPMKRKYKQ